jgi:hypothetical protein
MLGDGSREDGLTGVAKERTELAAALQVQEDSRKKPKRELERAR